MEFIILKTRIIAGHKMELEKGTRYLASRPIATKEEKDFPVKIRRHADDKLVLEIPGLTRDQANIFLSDFNNGAMSFDGRVW